MAKKSSVSTIKEVQNFPEDTVKSSGITNVTLRVCMDFSKSSGLKFMLNKILNHLYILSPDSSLLIECQRITHVSIARRNVC